MNDLLDFSLDSKMVIRSCISILQRENPENLQDLNETIEREGVANCYVIIHFSKR